LGKRENISPKVWNETRVSNLSTPIQHILGIPNQAIRLEKEIKVIQISEELVKQSLFTDDLVSYLKDPKNSIPKLLDTINSFSKVSGYKTNVQKSAAFLYINNEQIEKAYRKTSPFMIVSKSQIHRNKHNTDVNDL
jgi:hypothetical protein